MDVVCIIEDYSKPPQERVKVCNNWCSSNLVELHIGDKKYVVSGRELKKAIDNAMNN